MKWIGIQSNEVLWIKKKVAYPNCGGGINNFKNRRYDLDYYSSSFMHKICWNPSYLLCNRVHAFRPCYFSNKNFFINIKWVVIKKWRTSVEKKKIYRKIEAMFHMRYFCFQDVNQSSFISWQEGTHTSSSYP